MVPTLPTLVGARLCEGTSKVGLGEVAAPREYCSLGPAEHSDTGYLGRGQEGLAVDITTPSSLPGYSW